MRLSVTELDAFRYYRDDEDADLESLLRRLRKEDPPSRPMLAGKAFHAILEHAQPGDDLTTVERDGFRFHFGLDCEFALHPVRELKGDIVLPTPVGPVTLVGVVDSIGRSVCDYKLTARFDPDRYIDSYQWRCYLLMFHAHRFDYEVFVAKEDEKTGDFTVYDYHPMPFYAYPGMMLDVLREVGEFAKFAATFLPERNIKEAA